MLAATYVFVVKPSTFDQGSIRPMDLHADPVEVHIPALVSNSASSVPESKDERSPNVVLSLPAFNNERSGPVLSRIFDSTARKFAKVLKYIS